jgi:hypothetical protein
LASELITRPEGGELQIIGRFRFSRKMLNYRSLLIRTGISSCSQSNQRSFCAQKMLFNFSTPADKKLRVSGLY